MLLEAVKIVNSIKSKTFSERCFSLLRNEMGSEHQHLLFHTEVRWLSRGNVLHRLFELKDELLVFLTSNDSPYIDLLSNAEWLVLLACLADIFDKLNSLNLTLQGKDKNILKVSDTILGFVQKMRLWNSMLKSQI